MKTKKLLAFVMASAMVLQHGGLRRLQQLRQFRQL